MAREGVIFRRYLKVRGCCQGLTGQAVNVSTCLIYIIESNIYYPRLNKKYHISKAGIASFLLHISE